MKLKISVTKEHLIKSAYCGKSSKREMFSDLPHINNCAIAVAVHDLIPYASVRAFSIANGTRISKKIDIKYWQLSLPREAQQFICRFDSLSPEERMKMEPFSFEVELTDEFLENVNFPEMEEMLKEINHLELVKEECYD